MVRWPSPFCRTSRLTESPLGFVAAPPIESARSAQFVLRTPSSLLCLNSRWLVLTCCFRCFLAATRNQVKARSARPAQGRLFLLSSRISCCVSEVSVWRVCYSRSSSVGGTVGFTLLIVAAVSVVFAIVWHTEAAQVPASSPFTTVKAYSVEDRSAPNYVSDKGISPSCWLD
jgi:hypothetical protein